jgi:hypothetical protein
MTVMTLVNHCLRQLLSAGCLGLRGCNIVHDAVIRFASPVASGEFTIVVTRIIECSSPQAIRQDA